MKNPQEIDRNELVLFMAEEWVQGVQNHYYWNSQTGGFVWSDVELRDENLFWLAELDTNFPNNEPEDVPVEDMEELADWLYDVLDEDAFSDRLDEIENELKKPEEER